MAKKRTTYDELYWTYKGWVVLILKQFMYKAYDENARVLSFITDYKLYESKNGIAFGYPAHKSSVVPLKDGRKNYWRDENGDYFVPKYALEEIVRYL